MEYVYKISGLTSNEAFLKKINGVKGISSASIKDDILTVTIESGFYEYDVLTDIFKVCDGFSVNLDFMEESVDNGTIGGDFVENEGDLSKDLDENPSPVSPRAEKTDQISPSPSFEEVDLLEKEAKQFKSDLIFRIGEVSLSIILFVVSLFLKGGSGGFSLHTVILVLAFSIAGYDVVYGLYTDIKNKAPLNGNLTALLAAVSAVVLGHAAFGALFIILFSAARNFSAFADRYKELSILKSYYTGSLPVLVGEEQTSLQDLKIGDTITLEEGQYIPCDGTSLSDGEVLYKTASLSAPVSVKKGDPVFAGSIALAAGLLVKVESLFGHSVIDGEGEAFLSHKEAKKAASKSKKVAKIALYVDFCAILLSLIITFIPPIFTQSYGDNLSKWALIGAALLGIVSLHGIIGFYLNAFDNLVVTGVKRSVLFGDERAVSRLALGNDLTVDAAVLVEDGKVKEDAYGMLNEFLACGVKNVKVDFKSASYPESVVCDLDFTQNPVKKPKEIFAGNNGDISLTEGKNRVLNDQISFMPLAYKMAKNTASSAKAGLILSAVLKVVSLALIFVIPAVSPIVFLSVSALGEAICSALCLAGLKKFN